MPRLLISLLTACYAIAFAFGAMAAIRWPSLMMLANLLFEDNAVASLNAIDWRQLGIAYGAPYFLAGLCLYASALAVSRKRKGAFTWFIMGSIAGFPCVFLVDFEPGWWQDPSAGEGAVAGAALGAILLAIAIWNLRPRRPRPAPAATVPAPALASPAPLLVQTAPSPQMPKPRRVAPAIARQRAMWAAQGRRARQRRLPQADMVIEN